MSFGARMVGVNAMISGIDQLIDVQLSDNVAFVVGTNVEYAVYQEYGTKYMEPNPFLRPAARDAKRNISKFVKRAESLEVATEEIALFIEKRAKELAPVDTGNLQGSIATQKVQ